jgi:hypothetical protein
MPFISHYRIEVHVHPIQVRDFIHFGEFFVIFLELFDTIIGC